mmetsp:Transcript_18297/g.50435  ORF Transcript_18297/g.50435 Transcript_18297/m.50435 type:complete len:464 (-) Transcript_18297:943-2334(-)
MTAEVEVGEGRHAVVEHEELRLVLQAEAALVRLAQRLVLLEAAGGGLVHGVGGDARLLLVRARLGQRIRRVRDQPDLDKAVVLVGVVFLVTTARGSDPVVEGEVGARAKQRLVVVEVVNHLERGLLGDLPDVEGHLGRRRRLEHEAHRPPPELEGGGVDRPLPRQPNRDGVGAAAGAEAADETLERGVAGARRLEGLRQVARVGDAGLGVRPDVDAGVQAEVAAEHREDAVAQEAVRLHRHEADDDGRVVGEEEAPLAHAAAHVPRVVARRRLADEHPVAPRARRGLGHFDEYGYALALPRRHRAPHRRVAHPLDGGAAADVELRRAGEGHVLVPVAPEVAPQDRHDVAPQRVAVARGQRRDDGGLVREARLAVGQGRERARDAPREDGHVHVLADAWREETLYRPGAGPKGGGAEGVADLDQRRRVLGPEARPLDEKGRAAHGAGVEGLHARDTGADGARRA